MNPDRSPRWWVRGRVGCAIGAGVFALCLWLQPSFAELRSPNPLVRIYLTRALVDDGTVAIDGPMARFGHLADRARRDNHYYCDKAPGISLLAVPLYGAMRLVAGPEQISNELLLDLARLLLCALPAAISLIWIDLWLLGLGVGVRRRAAAVAALGGGSIMLPYSLELFGHTPAAFFVTWCAYFALGGSRLDAADGPPRCARARALLAGLGAGLAVLTEYPTLFLVSVLLLAAWASAPRRLRFALWVACGGLVPAIAFALYHWCAFGGPFTTGYAFIEDPFFRSVHAQGFMGLAAPTIEAFFASFFSPARGVFFASPWLLAAPFGALLLWRRRRTTSIALLTAAIAYAFFTSSFRYWIGGWAIGQRHLTPIMPLAALAAGVALEAVHRGFGRWQRIGRPLLAALCAIGVLQIAGAALTMPTFAEEFENPFFELTLRLWRCGLFPHTLGSWIGLPSRAGILVPVLIELALVLVCLRSASLDWLPAAVDGTRRAGSAALIGIWFAIAPLCGQGSAASEHRFEWIVDTVWEPRDALPGKLPDPVKTLPYLKGQPPQTPAMLRHLARHLAASGESDRAAELIGQAILLQRRQP
ncbi:MAG: hypothetical protein JXR83_03270 [Deltaproteobacteria bacterium]|nr:hypothetical protein [Deltaproteobacteria bacterium]